MRLLLLAEKPFKVKPRRAFFI